MCVGSSEFNNNSNIFLDQRGRRVPSREIVLVFAGQERVEPGRMRPTMEPQQQTNHLVTEGREKIRDRMLTGKHGHVVLRQGDGNQEQEPKRGYSSTEWHQMCSFPTTPGPHSRHQNTPILPCIMSLPNVRLIPHVRQRSMRQLTDERFENSWFTHAAMHVSPR